MRRIFSTFLVLFSMLSNGVLAQDESVGVLAYGNQNQPGTRLHEEIQSLMLNGETLFSSSRSVINNALSETSTLLSAKASQVVSADKRSTVEFMRLMVTTNNLFDVTKVSIENSPENTINIINLSVALYPDFAQEVINAAVMSGEMNSSDALLAAITAGADPTSIGEATAAGGPVELVLAAPVGVGIGAGGTGGGDATASTN